MKHCAFIAFGANLGDREQTWHIVLARLAILPHCQLFATSSLYETEPVGGPPQPHYLNAVLGLKTDLSAQTLLVELQRLETDMGRVRNVPWGPRTLDLDLLLFDDWVLDETQPVPLQLPHPRMNLRRFVLKPLADIAADIIHPQQQATIAALLRDCPDTSSVVPYLSPIQNATRFPVLSPQVAQKTERIP